MKIELNHLEKDNIKVAICSRLDYLLNEYYEEVDPSLTGLWADITYSISTLKKLGYDLRAQDYENRVAEIKEGE